VTDPHEAFREERRAAARAMAADDELRELTRRHVVAQAEHGASYNWSWLGRPIIQLTEDIVALQEVIWGDRPDLVVETGVAWGGSVVLSASILALLGGAGRVVGVDIEVRPHNRAAIEAHPLADRITLVEGSSIDPAVVAEVQGLAEGAERVVVVLDSNHTHAHVAAELDAYADLVTPGCHLVVLDTVVEHLPETASAHRPWGPGDNPLTAVQAFLAARDDFEVDRDIEDKLLLTAGPGGWLRRKPA
jgi:cephalosporin hydroxylase